MFGKALSVTEAENVNPAKHPSVTPEALPVKAHPIDAHRPITIVNK
jgi:hypothetical protein